jgi:two-component system, LytTR family, sensor kinase
MNKIKMCVGILIIVIVFIIGFFYVSNHQSKPNKAEEGVFHFAENQRNWLVGEWSFGWGMEGIEENRFAQVPSMWNFYKDINWSGKKGIGYGTFELIIKDIQPDKNYMFRFPVFGTDARVFANGELIYDTGNYREQSLDKKTTYQVNYVRYSPAKDSITLTAYISNYSYARGGMWMPIIFGEEKEMWSFQILNYTKEAVGFGMMLAMIIIVIPIFFIKKLKLVLYFVLEAILIGVYILTTGDKLLSQWFPNISIGLIVHLQYLVMFTAPTVFLLFLNELIPQTNSKKVMVIWKFYALVMGSVSLFLPLFYLTQLTYFANLMVYLSVLHYIIILISQLLQKNKIAKYLMFAGLLMTITIIHDLLYGSTFVFSYFGELIYLGFIVLTISNIIVLGIEIKRIYLSSLETERIKSAYLNAQIKPHFIFNVLNTIISTVKTEPDQSEEMLIDLSRYLRQILSIKTNQLIPIEEEIRLTSLYIEMQKARFPKIVWGLEMSTSQKSFSIPPLILQPLIENAITHGLKKKFYTGEIIIKITDINNCVFFSVSDSGVGMSEDKLKHVKKRFMNESAVGLLIPENKKHIGLVNVYLRLVDAGFSSLSISSQENQGTIVSFSLKIR